LGVVIVGVGVPQRVRFGRAVGHLAEGQALDDVGVAVGVEVLVRAARQPGAAERLEVLGGMPGDAGLVERVAE
jgi:hypothetical protein